MKKYVLTLLLCAFAISFSPLASAAPETALANEKLPVFKKKKGSMARYKQIKRSNGSYKKRITSHKKKPLF